MEDLDVKTGIKRKPRIAPEREDGYFFAVADKYADDVISGAIPASIQTNLACQRWKRDLKNQSTYALPYTFDYTLADRAGRFIESLTLPGRVAFILEPWQCFVLSNIFGWVDSDYNRRFQVCYVEIPRKNGKTAFAAGIALYCLIADGEDAAEVYTAAAKRDQAVQCLRYAADMVNRDSELRSYFGVEANKHAVFVPSTSSSMKALARDRGGSMDGLNTHCAIIDELHAHPTPATWDSMRLSTGSREQALILAITTAGESVTSICFEVHRYAERVLSGSIVDDTFFGVVYCADPEDDWKDPKTWAKANPNLGVSVALKRIRSQFAPALTSYTQEKAFRIKILNSWIGATSQWLDVQRWDECADAPPEEDVAKMKGIKYVVTIDLAERRDFCALVRLYWRPREEDGLPEYWLYATHYNNEERIRSAVGTDLAIWASHDLIEVSPGAETNHLDVQRDVMQYLYKKPLPTWIGFDPYNAATMKQEVSRKARPLGLSKRIVDASQTLKAMSAPAKEFEAAVMSKRIHHTGDPVLRWMVSNAVVTVDTSGNIKPKKDPNTPDKNVDAVIAAIMGVQLSWLDPPPAAAFAFSKS